MAEASQTPATVSTPSSSAPTTTQNGSVTTKASKDRACPFCNQPFTSSSLGRHLDLYIKPKNPKPPDGIHDVDKIRAMRGGITRRQPRVSLKGRSEGEVGSDRGTPMSGTPNGQWGRRLTIGSQDTTGGAAGAAAALMGRDTAMASPVNMREDSRGKFAINAAHWQATGVINNLPPRSMDGANPKYTPRFAPTIAQVQAMALRKDGGGENGEQELWTRIAEEREAGKAADLALRDVLGSLEAARSRVMQARLFDFDFYSMNFPSLCLHVLPSPPALFSMTPFASSESWPLNAPGHPQLEAVKRQVSQRIQQRRANLSDGEIQKLQMHLQDAWNHWAQLPEKEKTATWQVEVLRAYARAGQIAQEKEAQLAKAHQDLESLQEQYDQLCRHQLPRELILHPPSTLSINAASLLEELSSKDAQDRVWDYDRLIDRWRGVVKATKSTGRTLDDHASTPAPPTDKHNTPSTSFDVRANRPQPANGHQAEPSVLRRPTNSSYQDEENEEDEDADADADADADDDDMDADGEEAPESSTSAHHNMQDSSRWGNNSNSSTAHQRVALSDTQQAAKVNANGKRPQPAQYAQDMNRAKGMKMYHQGPLPGDGDVFGRAIGQV